MLEAISKCHTVITESLQWTAIIGSVASVFSALFAYLAHRDSFRIIKYTMRDEYKDFNHQKKELWTIIEPAYLAFLSSKQNSGLPRDLKTLIRSVKIHPAILAEKKDLRRIVINGPTADHRLMDEFVRSIYPVKKQSPSLIQGVAFDRFNEARSDIADFWDRWTKRRSLRIIIKEYNGNDKELLCLLTWLDYAHRAYVDESNKLKEKMYQLADRQLKKE